ncbi:hydroxyacylglutathione hydrolase [Curvivirga aplysinae]|uniref:hydroxyacylglutathione hydrolase n=1 Tax=Curvivirga aplysinae TaxID=2529852 RepID=UPI0012BCFCE9|nr:hydroxyacylglutathione hydrolase [Curvivirga aplysinae]MTI09469.1 hydroxyacylglutathione hydrolase [Curvivirga aplysinae]
MLEIVQIPVWDDNYIYLVHEPNSKKTAVVDPAEAKPVLDEANKRGWQITHILNTHHHFDHVGGNEDIQKATGAIVAGAANDTRRIPGISITLADGDEFEFGQSKAKIFDTPGHTKGHIAYWFEDSQALFCGDTLFALGCGRLFEGSPEQMWDSLLKLRNLPTDTNVYCAHEYTSANADFAITIEPKNEDLKKRVEKIKQMRDLDMPTVPSKLKEEVKTNPFLRADDADIAAFLKLDGEDPATVFAEIRRRKDKF